MYIYVYMYAYIYILYYVYTYIYMYHIVIANFKIHIPIISPSHCLIFTLRLPFASQRTGRHQQWPEITGVFVSSWRKNDGKPGKNHGKKIRKHKKHIISTWSLDSEI